MWIFLKKQGRLFDPDRDDFYIRAACDNGRDEYDGYIDSEFELVFTREQLDMFVQQFDDALKHRVQVMTFDQDKPKYTMRLSGRSDSEELVQIDVGLE